MLMGISLIMARRGGKDLGKYDCLFFLIMEPDFFMALLASDEVWLCSSPHPLDSTNIHHSHQMMLYLFPLPIWCFISPLPIRCFISLLPIRCFISPLSIRCFISPSPSDALSLLPHQMFYISSDALSFPIRCFISPPPHQMLCLPSSSDALSLPIRCFISPPPHQMLYLFPLHIRCFISSPSPSDALFLPSSPSDALSLPPLHQMLYLFPPHHQMLYLFAPPLPLTTPSLLCLSITQHKLAVLPTLVHCPNLIIMVTSIYYLSIQELYFEVVNIL